MHKKFEINQTKIKGGGQSGRKVVSHNSNRDLPLNTGLKNHQLTTITVQWLPEATIALNCTALGYYLLVQIYVPINHRCV